MFCAPHNEFVQVLTKGKYKEVPVWRGLTDGGSVMLELWQSQDGATWTMTYSKTDGSTCMLMAGEDGQTQVPVYGDPS